MIKEPKRKACYLQMKYCAVTPDPVRDIINRNSFCHGRQIAAAKSIQARNDGIEYEWTFLLRSKCEVMT